MASFEEAAATLSSVDETGLSTVSKLAQEQLSIERRIADLEEMVSDAKKNLREVSEDLLPNAMAEYGISELKLSDGSEISVGKFYSASITKARQEEAFDQKPSEYEICAWPRRTGARICTRTCK